MKLADRVKARRELRRELRDEGENLFSPFILNHVAEVCADDYEPGDTAEALIEKVKAKSAGTWSEVIVLVLTMFGPLIIALLESLIKK